MLSAESSDLVPVDAVHSAKAVLRNSEMPSVVLPRLTSARTRASISSNAGAGNRRRTVSSCGSTVTGSNTRP